MYCNNCGKFLLENDKFCSNCGARVFLNEQSAESESPTEDFKTDASQDSTPKVTPPVENIKWNIEDFPDHELKKTEEINFDWGNTSGFKKTEAMAAEIAFNPVQKSDTPEPTQGGFIEVEAVVDTIIQGKDLEEEIFAEASLVESIPTGGESHKRTKIVDKFYTFSKKNEEFQKLLDKEYEKIKAGDDDSLDEQTFRDRVTEINQQSEALWPEFNPTEHIAEMALARERFFGPMEDPYKEVKEEETPIQEAPTVDEIPSVEESVTAEEPTTADEPKADEDQNSLLGEEPLPEENILPDLEICKDEQTMPDHQGAPCIPMASVEAEPALAFSTPLDDNLIPEDFEDPRVDEPKEEEPVIEETKSEDDVRSIRDKWIQYDEDEDEENGKHSGSKVGKFIIGFLIVILLVEVALMSVWRFMPESAVAQFVDEQVQKVVQFFQGEDNNSLAMVTDRSIAAKDKTGLIQLQIDKNYNSNIEVIKYNEDLRLNTTKEYSDVALNQSTILQNNKWYTKEDGNAAYYDDQAVGAIISYESTRKLAEGESFATLEIGEIRISGENLYVWVAEEITPGDRQEKIFRITISGEAMSVNTEYDV
jgi:hypothetical protein